MRIIGLDLSLNCTGCAIFDFKEQCTFFGCFVKRDYLSKKIVDVVNEKNILMLQHETLYEQVNNILKIVEPDDLIFIEGLSFGSKGNSGLDLAKLHGMLCYALASRGLTPEFISPKSVKKFATGNGSAKKSDMIQRFNSEGVINFPNKKPFEDIIDAFWVGKFGGNM